MKIRDRIKEFKRVKASELEPNPLNWRTHSNDQRDAMKGLLAEIGIAGAVIAYKTQAGDLRLIDGHLRAEQLANNVEIPTLVLDVNEDEARKILATFDPISAMAGQDQDMLREVLAGIDIENAAVQAMLDQVLGNIDVPQFEPVGIDQQSTLDEKKPITCPECGHEFQT